MTESKHKLSRRNFLRAGAVGGAAIAGPNLMSRRASAIACGGVCIGAGLIAAGAIGAGAHAYLTCNGDTRGVAEYTAAERLQFWSEAVQETIRTDMDEEHLTVVHEQAIGSASVNYVNQSVIELLEDQQSDAPTATDLASAKTFVADDVKSRYAALQEWAIDQFHLNVMDFVNFVQDAQNLSDVSVSDMIAAYGASGNEWAPDKSTPGDASEPFGLLGVYVDGPGTVTYELADGSTIERDMWRIEFDMAYGMVSGYGVARGDDAGMMMGATVSNYSHPYGPTSDSDAVLPSAMFSTMYSDRTSDGHIRLEPFPMTEYENLDDESKEAIQKPPEVDYPMRLFAPRNWVMILDDYSYAVSDAVANAETFVDNSWTKISSQNPDPSQFMSPSMLAAMSADHNDVAYSSAVASATGLGRSEPMTKVRFPEGVATALPADDSSTTTETNTTTTNTTSTETTTTEGELSSTLRDEGVWGNLYAYPEMSGGLPSGSVIDPSNFTASFTFETEIEGQLVSWKIRNPFEVVEAKTVDDETGEFTTISGDTVNFSGQTSEPAAPTTYDEFVAAMEALAETERDAETVQREIVIENTGGGGGIDFGNLPVPGWALVAAAVAGFLALGNKDN